MAATEVTAASPGDAEMLKDEEAGPSDKEAEPSDKTPVTLHLQPVLQGVNDDIADTGTTVLAIETHHDDDDVEGDEVEYGYPISCGDSRAVLLFKKFVCPGINVRCVKFNEQLISPKQFVHLAGKATLKDWKRAIRLGGVMLRKMMDSGQIDFYQHDTVCTNTCRSTKFDLMINSSRLPPAGGSTVLPGPSSLAAAEPAGGQLAPMAGGEVVKVDHSPEEKVSVTEEWSHGPPPPTSTSNTTPTLTATNGHVDKKKRPDMPAGMLGLWQGVAEEGLMGDVLSSIHTELLSALRGVESRADQSSLNHKDAFILNSLCETFGLLDSVKRALERRRTHCEDTTTHTTHFYVLEESLGEQKEKGYHGESRSHKAVSSKRPRLHRHNTPTGQTQNLTRHGATSGPVVQPLTAAGPAAAPQAKLTASPQRYRHCSASGSAQAGRDGHSATLEAWERLHRLGQERGEVEVDSGTRGSREDDPDPRRPRHEGRQDEYVLGSEPAVRGKKVSKKHKTNRQPAQEKWSQ